MSEHAAEVNEGKKAPVTEWPLTSEEDFRVALPKMMKFRGLIMQSLAAKMGNRNLFSPFLSGKQKHIRADSFFDAILAMELEVVVRPPQTSKTQRRIEAVKADTLKRRAALARQVADTLAEQAAEAAAEAENKAA